MRIGRVIIAWTAALLVLCAPAKAQINTDRMMSVGRTALYYDDYVVSIQYFNQVINAKPYLAEPYFYRAVAKYYLEDYAGCERDCSEALQRNPYVVNIYELRGLSRIQQKKYGDTLHSTISYNCNFLALIG